MFKWFKKLKNVDVDSTSNLNGLYTARIADLKKLQKRIETLNNQLTELNNKVDALPPIPDHSMYARKDQTNTFTQKQTFNRGMYVNNQKIEGIGTPTENGDATHKLYVDNADSQTRNSATRFTNTKFDEAKQYADTKDSQIKVEMSQLMDTKISQMDTSNFAKLDQQNTFTQAIRANKGISVKGDISADTSDFGSGMVQDVPNNAKSIVNKEYVDYKAGQINDSGWWYDKGRYKVRIKKRTWGNIYSYDIWPDTFRFDVSAQNLKDGWYQLIIRITKIGSGDGNTSDFATLMFPTFATVKNGIASTVLRGQVILARDLYVGYEGDFDGSIWIMYGYSRAIAYGTPSRESVDSVIQNKS